MEVLPPSVRRYLYQGEEHFCQILRREHDRLQNSVRNLRNTPDDAVEITEYIVFFIDAPTFERDFCDPNTAITTLSCRSSYSPTTNVLTIKMLTPEHDRACYAFGKAVDMALVPMGLDRTILPYAGVGINVNGRVKQADYGLGPRRPPPGRRPPSGSPKKPTVVMEVAVSETQAKLRRDVDLWLNPERGNANVAISMKANRKKPVLTVDKWEWDATNQQSQNTQHIVIAESESGDQVTVSQAPLVIPFHLLFGRPPSSPRETDIYISQQELVEIATLVWESKEY